MLPSCVPSMLEHDEVAARIENGDHHVPFVLRRLSLGTGQDLFSLLKADRGTVGICGGGGATGCWAPTGTDMNSNAITDTSARRLACSWGFLLLGVARRRGDGPEENLCQVAFGELRDGVANMADQSQPHPSRGGLTVPAIP